jgi:23S rRNA pseudouridine2605 synthase
MAKAYFDRFRNEKPSVIKEKIRQEKKQARKEKQEFFDQKKEEAKQAKLARQANEDAKTNPRFKAKGGRSEQVQEAPKYENLKPAPMPEKMPLNKYVSHAGICSRRDAAELVKSGKISINGKVVTEPGYKVSKEDEVQFNGKKISAKKNLVYILLNKPKDYITTMEDPEGRKTVFDLIRSATAERVYPVGRLDRNTTGVLLFTNDGDLAQKLSHPSYQVKKIYEVKLDKSMARKDMEDMMAGITLEDGFIQADAVAYADSKDKSVIGVEIHSGRNRIVRRMFEHLGYDVRGLDRVMFANLTKKNVDRGKWRFLAEKEVRLLKFMNASYARKKEENKFAGKEILAKDSSTGKSTTAKSSLASKEKMTDTSISSKVTATKKPASAKKVITKKIVPAKKK